MADNVAITEGSGKSVATDDVGGQQYQRMKLDLGTDGAAAPALAGAGTVATGVQRVTLASDDPAVAKLGTIDTDTGIIAGDTTSINGKIVVCNTGAVVLASGSVTIGKLASNSGVDIGDVTLNAGTAEIGKLAAGTAEIGNIKNSGTFAVQSTLQTGSNVIGKLAANNGVDIGDVDVTSIIPLTGATNLGKARDSILGASDVGVMALAVRDDTLTTLTPADGDYVPLRVSSTGQLHVTGGGGGTQYNIDTVLGGAATTTLAGVVRDDSLTTLTEADGDISVLRVSSTGQLYVTGGGGGTEYTEDVVTANPQIGSAIMMERDDALTTVTPAEADWIGLRGTAEGALWTQDFNSDAALVLLGTIDTDTGVIAGDTTSINGKITACDTGAVVLATGSAAIGKLAANSGVDIGDVTLTAGTALVGKVSIDQVTANANEVVVKSGTITAVTDITNVVSVDDNAASLTVDTTGTSGLEIVQVTAADLNVTEASATAIKTAVEKIDDWDAVHASASSSDGPQIMGAGYSTGLTTDIGADGDAARICTDRFGRVLAGLMPQNFQATFTSADAQAAAPVKVKTASRKMYILSLVVSVDTAMSVQFQDDTGPTVLIEQLYLAANGGAHLTWPPEAPLVVNTNEDFDVLASVAGNISVTITGYLAV